MSYGLRYRSFFDAISGTNPNFRLDIYKKNYTGDYSTITLGATPVIHEWAEDDPKKAIKGSSLKISIINDGTISLESFYSNEEDEFIVEFYNSTTEQLLFKGYIIQEDCNEILIDFNHEILINATDSLGILKDINLYDASLKIGTTSTNIGLSMSSASAGGQYVITVNTPLVYPYTTIRPNSIVTVGGGTFYDGDYTVKEIQAIVGGFYIKVKENCGNNAPALSNLIFTIPTDISGIVSLSTLFRLCLISTGLNLQNSYVWATIIPKTKSHWLENTYINANTFLNNDVYDSCYDVLDKILSRFKATLFQSYGYWQIVRWGELRLWSDLSGATLVGKMYDELFFPDSNETLQVGFECKDVDDIETGIIKSIIRPYKTITETFNYNQVSLTIKNSDFQELGPYRGFTNFGAVDYHYYDALYWNPEGTYTINDYKIIVVKDATTGEELERFIGTYNSPSYLVPEVFSSTPADVSIGDELTFGFSFRTWIPHIGDGYFMSFQLLLTDGTTTYSLDNDGSWAGGIAYYGYVGADSSDWQSFNIDAQSCPISGTLKFVVNQVDFNPPAGNANTFVKNISLVLKSNSDKNFKKITGQSHIETQTYNIKNVNSYDIYMDDSPSNIIRGTLFLNDVDANGTRTKTTFWEYDDFPMEYNTKLGELVTFEEMFQRWKARYKLEFTIIDIYRGGFFINPLSVIKYLDYPLIRFVIGSLSINYKMNTAALTCYGLYATEDIDDLRTVDSYEFKYIYENN